ncbi:MAG: Fur family transcriptional regulator [Dethiosulfovibrio peptidovorans]|nr:MAG: Fur family transcriptional regulator [Dethiosulfovibrio peptidovorans]
MPIQRRTRQRDAVFQVVSRLGHHPTAEEVFWEVRQKIPNVSLGTVYRNLDQLCEAGHILKIPGGDGPCRYEGNGQDHLHVRCPSCGELRDIWPKGDPVNRSVFSEDLSQADFYLEFISPCPKCCKASES